MPKYTVTVTPVILNGKPLNSKSSRSGCYRRAYLTKTLALKVPADPSKYTSGHANRSIKAEVKLWKRLGRRGRRSWLAPILAYGKAYDWILMRRAKKPTYAQTRKYALLVDRRARLLGIGDVGGEEGHNWGMLDGKPVIYDYAQ